jgi:hypothetical protein
MDRVIAPSHTPDPQLQLHSRPKAEPGPAAEAAAPRPTEDKSAALQALTPDRLTVSLDASAGRFVQTLTDIETEETVRKYPSDAQLAYSRAVMTYLRALYDVSLNGKLES